MTASGGRPSRRSERLMSYPVDGRAYPATIPVLAIGDVSDDLIAGISRALAQRRG